MTWLESCRTMPCHPAYQRTPRAGLPMVSAALLHFTAPPLWTAEQYARALQQPPEKRQRSKWSAHAIVDEAGDGVQCVPLDKEASHAGDGVLWGRSPNIGTAGIEIVNAGFAVDRVPKAQQITARHRNPKSASRQWHAFREEQYKTVASIIHELTFYRPDPNKPLLLLGHEDTCNDQVLGRAGAKLDPGPAFDWDALMRLLAGDYVQRIYWDFTLRRLVRVANDMYDAEGRRVA